MSSGNEIAGNVRLTEDVNGKSLQQTVRESKQAVGAKCQLCSNISELGSRFCTTCGACLLGSCAACGADNLIGGDICEACGHWLLHGQCCLCYATLSEGAQFCEQCGANQKGTTCPQCQSTGIFDFCSKCGAAVSERSLALATRSLPDPALEEALLSLRSAQRAIVELNAAEAANSNAFDAKQKTRMTFDGALRALREMGAAVNDQQQRERQRAADAEAAAQETAQLSQQAVAKAAEEVRNQEERAQAILDAQPTRLKLSVQLREAQAKMEKLIEDSNSRTYPTDQEARLEFMLLRERLCELGRVPTFWRCNAYNCSHPTPNECAKPSSGGVWLFA